MPDALACQVVGAGPAGMSFILALCNRIAQADSEESIAAQALLDSLLMLEASPRPGGKMGRYRINANTDAHDVVKGILDGNPFTPIRDRYLDLPETQSVLIPLPTIERLMVQPLVTTMLEFLGPRLRCGEAVNRVVIGEQGFASHATDGSLLACSDNLLLCCGGRESLLPALSGLAAHCETSVDFLLRDNLEALNSDDSPIIIIGASHSAFSCAWRLLYDPLFADYVHGREIIMLQRREKIKLRCTPAFAKQHDIEYDAELDLCPVSGNVFHNAGLRKDAKMLYLRIRDGEEKRVRLVAIDEVGDRQDLLDAAGLILQATGFGPNLPPIERDGELLEIGEPGQRGELSCRQGPIPGLYGLGLGINIPLQGDARGEKSFRGSINGFLSYPLVLAPLIIDQLLANSARRFS